MNPVVSMGRAAVTGNAALIKSQGAWGDAGGQGGWGGGGGEWGIVRGEVGGPGGERMES